MCWWWSTVLWPLEVHLLWPKGYPSHTLFHSNQRCGGSHLYRCRHTLEQKIPFSFNHEQKHSFFLVFPTDAYSQQQNRIQVELLHTKKKATVDQNHSNKRKNICCLIQCEKVKIYRFFSFVSHAYGEKNIFHVINNTITISHTYKENNIICFHVISKITEKHMIFQ